MYQEMINWSKTNFSKCSNPQHLNSYAKFICLNLNCSNRLFCGKCFYDHRFHRVTQIEGAQQGMLSILSMNANSQKAKDNRDFFKQKYNLICKSFRDLNFSLQGGFQDLSSLLSWQYEAIWRSFDENTVKNVVEQLKKYAMGSKTQKNIQDYIKIFNILMNQNNSSSNVDFRDVQTLKDVISKQSETIINCIKDAATKINQILRNLQAKIKQASLNQTVYKQISQNQTNIAVDNKIQTEQKELIQDLDPIKIQEMGIVYENSSNSNKVQSIVLHNISTKALEQILKSYNKNSILQLGMKNNSKPLIINDESISQIFGFKNIKKLQIQYATHLSTSSIKGLIQNLGSLKELYLHNCLNISESCIQILVSSLPKIQKFYYGSDFWKSLKRLRQSSYFFDVYRKKSLNTQSTLSLFSLKALKNIWIGKCFKNQYAKVINNLNLEDITLGHFNHTMSIINMDLIDNLINNNHLKSITLIQISNSDSIIKVIQKNPLLQHLGFLYCDRVTDQLLLTIRTKCLKLKQLCIVEPKSAFKGTAIWEIKQIQVLILDQCPDIDSDTANKKISFLQNLTFLCLDSNKWVNNTLVRNIESIYGITCLSIDATSVTGECLQYLKNMKLTTLICGYTNINGKQLVQFSKKTNSLTKLCLAGLDGSISKQDLNEISKNHKITNVVLTNCHQFKNFTAEDICQIFPHLQGISAKLSIKASSILDKKGIYVKKSSK